jgi:acetyltransferase-like isoleucine patch superfamily enzyme
MILKALFGIIFKLQFFLLKKTRGLFYKYLIIGKVGKNFNVGKNVTILNGEYLSIGDNCELNDNVYIDAKSSHGISIGDRVTLNRNCYLQCFGDRNGEGISIGNDVTIGNNSIIYGHALVKIGDFTAIGPNVVIVPEDHKFNDDKLPIRKQGGIRKRIIIENNVWIASGSVILKGVTIGEGSVIGAGSIVTKTILKNSIAVGAPCKRIKSRI